jgi:hypothetical protein
VAALRDGDGKFLLTIPCTRILVNKFDNMSWIVSVFEFVSTDYSVDIFKYICREICSTYKYTFAIFSMTEITIISKAHSKFHSLKTTIPSCLVKEWKLRPGEILEWNWIVVNNKMLMTIQKACN